MIVYSYKMENYTLMLVGLIIICFLPQIHLLSILLITCIVELFNKLLRLVIHLLGMFFFLIFFSPVALLFIIFCVGILLF
jgi:hypothetical protein